MELVIDYIAGGAPRKGKKLARAYGSESRQGKHCCRKF